MSMYATNPLRPKQRAARYRGTEEPWAEKSRLLFGSQTRFEVCLWIATREGTFVPDEVCVWIARLGRYDLMLDQLITDTDQIHLDLIGAGMVKRVEDPSGKLMWLQKLDSPLWEIFHVAAAAMGVDGVHWEDQLRSTLLDMKERLG